MSASFRWILQLHKDVPKAAKFYSEGLDFTINVCTLRWAELQSGPLKLALLHSSRFTNMSNEGVRKNPAWKYADLIDPANRDRFKCRFCDKISNADIYRMKQHPIIGTTSLSLPPYTLSEHPIQKGYSSVLSFTVTDINNTVTKLMALGAELDGPIKYEIHGKVAAIRCVDGHMVGLHEPA